MTSEQLIIFLILCATISLFIWNRWRYDIVAGIALMACVYSGIVPVEHAFDGFAHPAVITVASVLVISQALQSSGIVEYFLRYLAYTRGSITGQLAANVGITAFLSGFMNNIGALALMLPITLRDARKARRSAAILLMPLSFASLLGGLTTLIGTPPNIVIATFRADNTGESFSMFDFTPVGLVTAVVGLIFLVTIGWRLLPRSSHNTEHEDQSHHQFARYVCEFRLPSQSPLVGISIGQFEELYEKEVSVIAIIRDAKRMLAPSVHESLITGDTVIVEGASESLKPLLENPDLAEIGATDMNTDWLRSPDVRVIEAVMMPNSAVEGVAMRQARLHERFGVNLLGVAREGRASKARLRHVRFKTGDVLLLQGEKEALKLACKYLGCLAIRNRGFEITAQRGVFLTPALFLLGIIATAFGLVPVQVAFTTVVGALVLLKLVSLQEAYNSIEWPVIVLLGFLIPVGEALQSTGATAMIAILVGHIAADAPVWALLALIMAISMLLSDVVHNTPTAVLMAPIAFSLASSLGYSTDAFLMAVAVGAASPYLTPIGHQSNTLVMGPGGYNFGDYWRMGLPLDIVILCTAVPMICWVWL
ncbi:MAG: SLC13 family permease, partial [Granulosicoccus sp.]|nr:SLC13 family permease [Granulosicoccus sp.]